LHQAGGRIHAAVVESLPEALELAFDKSQPGDAILLSPACPSFDQFADFAERGRLFEALFHALESSPREPSNPRR
jgi:UDP-N-acetylmuramoylalanine--D-glutamate ligase